MHIDFIHLWLRAWEELWAISWKISHLIFTSCKTVTVLALNPVCPELNF